MGALPSKLTRPLTEGNHSQAGSRYKQVLRHRYGKQFEQVSRQCQPYNYRKRREEKFDGSHSFSCKITLILLNRECFFSLR